MNLEVLRELVAQGESATLEFKLSTGQRSDGVRTACAMLNGVGGFVLFGVSNARDLLRQEVGSNTISDISTELRRIEPPVFPDIECVIPDSGRGVRALRLSVGGGPYTYDGRPYFRRGDHTELMGRERYERLLLERMHASNRWENQPSCGVTAQDLDIPELHRTVDEAIRRFHMEDPGTREPRDLLVGLGLIAR